MRAEYPEVEAAVVSSPVSRFAFLPGADAAAASSFDVAPVQLHVEASARGWSMRGRVQKLDKAHAGKDGVRTAKHSR